jgi:hypothetical protein
MRKFFRYYFILPMLFLSACSFYNSNIKKIDTISQAQQEFSVADKDTLVAFDIDNTLLDPNEKMFQIEYLKPEEFDDPSFVREIRADIKKLYASRGTDFKNNFISEIYQRTTFKPVELEEVTAIKELQARGVKVVVLTASYTGKFGKVKKMQKLRFKNLLDSGFDFRKSFDLKKMIFDKLAPRDGYFPMFYKGLILSSTSSKGQALGAFLDSIDWKPKKVIFFDELIINHQSVAQEMEKRRIPFLGFQYMADFREKIKLGDKQIIQYQYDYLVKNGVFLTNNQTLEQMKAPNVVKQAAIESVL